MDVIVKQKVLTKKTENCSIVSKMVPICPSFTHQPSRWLMILFTILLANRIAFAMNYSACCSAVAGTTKHYHPANGRCYVYHSDSTNALVANNDCRSQQAGIGKGEVWIVRSAAETTAVATALFGPLTNNNKTLWTAGWQPCCPSEPNGGWVWYDNVNAPQTGFPGSGFVWRFGEPNNLGGEDCSTVIVGPTDCAVGECMNDKDCNSNFQRVCEFPFLMPTYTQPLDGLYYRIINVETGKALSIPGGACCNGVHYFVETWTGAKHMIHVFWNGWSGSSRMIRNEQVHCGENCSRTGRCVDNNADGELWQWDCNAGWSTRYIFDDLGDPSGGELVIVNEFFKSILNVETNYEVENGQWTASNRHMWKIEKICLAILGTASIMYNGVQQLAGNTATVTCPGIGISQYLRADATTNLGTSQLPLCQSTNTQWTIGQSFDCIDGCSRSITMTGPGIVTYSNEIVTNMTAINGKATVSCSAGYDHHYLTPNGGATRYTTDVATINCDAANSWSDSSWECVSTANCTTPPSPPPGYPSCTGLSCTFVGFQDRIATGGQLGSDAPMGHFQLCLQACSRHELCATYTYFYANQTCRLHWAHDTHPCLSLLNHPGAMYQALA